MGLPSVKGQCSICGWSGDFLKPELEREGMICGNCSASSRHRAVMYALGSVLKQGQASVFAWPVNKSVRILESSARGSYPVMLADKYDYYATEYDSAKIAAGTDPRSFADFQSLHYADEMFDVVIASDVFEHVRKDADGYREIFRVLKKGGTFIMTVPYDHNREKTIVRVDTSGEKDVHLLEPEYHGGGGHTLTYRNYGRDLLSLLHSIGFATAHFETEVVSAGITKQSVIIGSKGNYLDVTIGGRGDGEQESLGVLLPYRLFLLLKYNIKGFLHYWKEMKRK